ncbi:hypothetical protein FRC03_002848 [Tulasnella sp. 419]|nr:hypothetical protein FRC03_002848 [Tulasnella sp. 419]
MPSSPPHSVTQFKNYLYLMSTCKLGPRAWNQASLDSSTSEKHGPQMEFEVGVQTVGGGVGKIRCSTFQVGPTSVGENGGLTSVIQFSGVQRRSHNVTTCPSLTSQATVPPIIHKDPVVHHSDRHLNTSSSLRFDSSSTFHAE